ncbi:hypothetical protein TNCV_5008541 [Trichonephila clavipes]|nr:hypothetical protein TNCV_5008541 [Trichonephila clavipes]
MPSPVQSNCDAHNTIENGQYGAVWSMRHTQQVCVRIVLLPSNVWQQFFGRSAFLRLVESFFKNDEGHNVTVNGDRYRAMITNFFIPELNNHDVQEL